MSIATIAATIAAAAGVSLLAIDIWNRFPHLGVEVQLDVDGQLTGEHRSATIWLRNRGKEPIIVHGVEFDTSDWFPNFSLYQARSLIGAMEDRIEQQPQFPISIDVGLERKWVHFSLTSLSNNIKAAGGGPIVKVRPVIRFNHERVKRGSWFQLFVDSWAWSKIVRGQDNFDPPEV